MGRELIIEQAFDIWNGIIHCDHPSVVPCFDRAECQRDHDSRSSIPLLIIPVGGIQTPSALRRHGVQALGHIQGRRLDRRNTSYACHACDARRLPGSIPWSSGDA
jgi:hypothetical protein